MFNPNERENAGWQGSEVLRSRNEPYALIPSPRPSVKHRKIHFCVSATTVCIQSGSFKLTSEVAPLIGREYDIFEMVGNQQEEAISNDLPQLISELETYADLPGNWDSEGALKPRKRAVNDALTFLENFPEDVPLPYPEVGRDGDVGIYWDNYEAHTFAQVVFDGDGCFTYIAIIKQPGRDRESYGGEDLTVTSDWPQDLTKVIRLRPQIP